MKAKHRVSPIFIIQENLNSPLNENLNSPLHEQINQFTLNKWMNERMGYYSYFKKSFQIYKWNSSDLIWFLKSEERIGE